MVGRFGRVRPAGVRGRQARACQRALAGDLGLRVGGLSRVDGLPGLKRRVHALGGYDGLPILFQNEGVYWRP
jgi:hypothetical protein